MGQRTKIKHLSDFGTILFTSIIVIVLLTSCVSIRQNPSTIEIAELETIVTTSLTPQETPITIPSTPHLETPTEIIVRSTPTPIATIVPNKLLEPIVIAARIFPYSWSPDSELLAYWTFTKEEAAIDFTFPPGTLFFFNRQTSEICQSSVNVSYGYSSPTLTWLTDGQVQVVTEQGVMKGTPCQDNFTIVSNIQNHNPTTLPSPDAHYFIETVTVGENQFVTSFVDAISNEVLSTVEWQSLGGLGERGIGGQWLTSNTFLIQETIQGPLLITASGDVVPVVSQLFNQSIETICKTTPCETTFVATGSIVEGTDTYHLILYGKGIEGDFPPIRLYHSESGLVEELNFRQQAGFSPDGRVLLLASSESIENEIKSGLWIRQVELPGSESSLLLTTDVNPFPIVWSPDSTKLVTSSSKDITIFSIPDGSMIETWDTNFKAIMPTTWSPDGQYLVVRGFSLPGMEEALFVIQVGG